MLPFPHLPTYLHTHTEPYTYTAFPPIVIDGCPLVPPQTKLFTGAPAIFPLLFPQGHSCTTLPILLQWISVSLH